MNPNLDTLATALYVKVDDLLSAHPYWAPPRPAVGIVPRLSDAELVTLAVIQALLRFTSEARFIRLRPSPSEILVSLCTRTVRLQQAPTPQPTDAPTCDLPAWSGSAHPSTTMCG